ncbi:MAG: hypothetical protein ACKVU1_10290 [bacterium]
MRLQILIDPHVAGKHRSPREVSECDPRIADFDTDIPGGMGAFVAFTPDPGFDRGRVAFQGQGGSGQTSVYTAVAGGPVELVADRGTPTPDAADDFYVFPAGDVSASGNAITFAGQSASGLRRIHTTRVSIGTGAIRRVRAWRRAHMWVDSTRATLPARGASCW